MLPHPCILGDPQQSITKSEVDATPLPSRGPKSATSPRILRDPQCQARGAKSEVVQKGTKSEVAASPLPSRGPKRGRKCYVTHAFLGVPGKGFKKGPH